MPSKKPEDSEEMTVFESIKNRIAERSGLIATLREVIEGKDEELLTMGIRVEDAERVAAAKHAAAVVEALAYSESLRAAQDANANMQTFFDDIRALPEFADLFPPEAETVMPVAAESDRPATSEEQTA